MKFLVYNKRHYSLMKTQRHSTAKLKKALTTMAYGRAAINYVLKMAIPAITIVLSTNILMPKVVNKAISVSIWIKLKKR